MDNKRQFILNLIASLVNFVANLGIGFLLTPFIVSRVGVEAYGFVGLANTVVNYAALFTLALNSVAGRFITVEYHKGNKDEADRYFTSTLSSNIAIVLVLGAVSMPVIANLEHIINISPHLVGDVKMLFALIVGNFLLTTLSTVFTVATFVKNKLYLSSIANIVAILVKILTFVIMYGTLPAKVFYVGVGSCLFTVIVLVMNWAYTKKLVPELRFVRRGFSWPAIRQMLAAGIWNSVVKLQQILQDGLSLLVANLMISPYRMGLLSVAQIVPMALSSLMGTIAGLFSPELTRYFAQNKKDELVRELNSSMRISGFFTNIIFVVLLLVGEDFIRLWQPGQDAREINILMQLTMLGFFLSGVATTLQGVPLIVNRLKGYSLIWLGFGFISFIMMTVGAWLVPQWGIYVVAGTPQVVGIIANLIFVPIYASWCLDLPKRAFYPVYLQYVGATVVAYLICAVAGHLLSLHGNNWIALFIECAAYAVLVIVVDVFLLLGARERATVLRKITRK